MMEEAAATDHPPAHAVGVALQPATEARNRWTAAFRFFLALPHLILVGGPAALGGWMSWQFHGSWGWSSGSGVLGVVVGLATLLAWFVIIFTGRHPDGLRRFATYYLRWRVRAIAYMTLLRDEYPPFGDGDGDGEYAAALVLPEPDPDAERNRLTVLFRIILAVPHLLALWLVGAVWALTTAIAWVVILITGRYPETLYGFAIGALAWTTRVEAYLLLLHDDYPPFTLRA